MAVIKDHAGENRVAAGDSYETITMARHFCESAWEQNASKPFP
jgi:hypothetical protein